MKSAKLVSATLDPAAASASKKRSIQDIFSSGNDEEDEPPRKKRSSKFEGLESEAAQPDASDVQDIQELLATTKRQIEERKRQNQVLLAQQGFAPQQAPIVLPTLSFVGLQNPLLQQPLVQHSPSVHPLAYSRELHLTRGMSMGPSALDKAVKAAEVQCVCRACLLAKGFITCLIWANLFYCCLSHNVCLSSKLASRAS